ncbi:hypothetical protein [Streptomyces sp. 3330]|uniref:hypothetical protein n=1 Tax=Streptomyces sp. 3330 TaxID=2817755 RepID=UPI00286C1B2E|nr:hypothetical protein [Streptomyces sp. 3330]
MGDRGELPPAHRRRDGYGIRDRTGRNRAAPHTADANTAVPEGARSGHAPALRVTRR